MTVPYSLHISVSKLPAGPFNIFSKCSSNTNIYTVIFKFLFKRAHMGAVRMGKAPLPDRVDRDQVDMCLKRPGELHESARVLAAVIDAADQAVFKCNTPPCHFLIIPASLDDLCERKEDFLEYQGFAGS